MGRGARLERAVGLHAAQLAKEKRHLALAPNPREVQRRRRRTEQGDREGHVVYGRPGYLPQKSYLVDEPAGGAEASAGASVWSMTSCTGMNTYSPQLQSTR